MKYTLAMVKSDAIIRGHLSAIIYEIRRYSIQIVAERLRWLNKADIEFLYAAHMDKEYWPRLEHSVKRGAYLMVLTSDYYADTVGMWRILMTGEENGKYLKGRSLRDRYRGEGEADNALDGSDSAERAAAEIAYFFPNFNMETGSVR